MFSWSWKKLWILLLVIPLLTACPPQPKLTLPSQAAQGESVTASLEGLNGEGAKVTVAGLEAVVTTATRDSITFIIPDTAPEGSQEVVILSGDQRATAKITIVAKQPGNQTFVLDRTKAARGEVVGATTTGVDLVSAKMTVGGKPATIEPTQEGFTFKVPDDVPAGPQTVILETKAGNLDQPLGVLGDVVPNKLTILLAPGVNPSRLTELGFRIEQIRSLDPSGVIDGPCSSTLVDIDVNGKPLGQAIEELEKENVALQVDPRTNYSAGSVDHLSTISASIARNNGYTGAGSTIAVLDTGVSEHPELTNTPGRLISPFNAITGGTDLADVADDFDDANVPTIPVDKQQPGVEGHGTPIAVLAAGNISGVASAASIMPIKAFGADGVGFSNDVIVGVCHALTSVPDLKKLILNLSFGGDTPVDALEAILKYALDNGVQVAAAAGNEGEAGSPKHYPAAYTLSGLVAVGALEASSLQCVDFQAKEINTRYDPVIPDPQTQPPILPTTFVDNGRTVTVEGFQFEEGLPPSVDNSFAVIEDERQGGGVVPDIQLSTARLLFTFETAVEGLSLRYGDFIRGNGGYNIAVNGELEVFFGSLTDVNEPPRSSLGGVAITALQDLDESGEPLPTGTLRLRGSISSLTIGGTSLWLDDICPTQTSAWQPAVFSTRGDYVDISAPGVALRSGTPGGIYATAYEGTSFSTPLVAGAMALWKEAEEKVGSLTPIDIEKRIKDNALPLSFPQDAVGTGLLNLNVEPFTSPLIPPIPLRAGN